MIRLRMRAGLARKRQAGGYAGGRPPYGWRAERGELVPIQAEQDVLELAQRGRARGLSWRQIVDELEDAGHRTRKGTKWSPHGIAKASTNSRRVSARVRNATPRKRGEKGEPIALAG